MCVCVCARAGAHFIVFTIILCGSGAEGGGALRSLSEQTGRTTPGAPRERERSGERDREREIGRERERERETADACILLVRPFFAV